MIANVSLTLNGQTKIVMTSENMQLNTALQQQSESLEKTFRKSKKALPMSFEKNTRKNYEKQKRKAVNRQTKSLQKYQSQTGRPLLLGDFDSMVQSYIVSMSNRGAVISRSIANSAAKALMKKHPGIIGNIDVDSSSWAQSLFRRMGYSRRRHTSAKVDIPEAARKEIEYLFLYEIVSKVEKYEIPESLIINFDSNWYRVERVHLLKRTATVSQFLELPIKEVSLALFQSRLMVASFQCS